MQKIAGGSPSGGLEVYLILILCERIKSVEKIYFDKSEFSFQFETGEVWGGQRMKGGIIHDSDLVSHSHQKLCKAKKRKSGKQFWSGEVSLGQGRGQRLPCIPIVRYRRLPPLPSVAILNHRSQRHQPRSTPSKVEPSTGQI